jgi:hypothetical protein
MGLKLPFSTVIENVGFKPYKIAFGIGVEIKHV